MGKIQVSRSLFMQIFFVTLAFALTIVISGIVVNNIMKDYLKREAMNRLTQTQILIREEFRESETLMVHIINDVRDIIMAGGGVDDVQEYYDKMSAVLMKKKDGFTFDILHGYFEAFGNAYIASPQWTPPDGYNPIERPWYKAIIEADGTLVMSPIYESARTGEYLINIGNRIFDDSGVSLGVVAMSIKFSNITQIVREMNIHEGGRGLLADENYIVVVPPDPAVLGWHMYEVAPAVRRIAEIMQQGEGFAYVEGKNFWGVDSIFYAIRLENGWILYFFVPKNVYLSDLQNLMLFFAFLGIAVMLVIIAILIRIDVTKNKTQSAVEKMQKEIEEKNRLANLGNILNGMETMIYISDPDTNEILFINEVMKRHYGIEGDGAGLICYKILQKDKNKRCSFCPIHRLEKEPDATVVWEMRNTLTNRIYRKVDRYIDWPNREKVHLQHSIDITDLKTMTARQSLMADISQSFLSPENIDVLITDALKAAGEFMGVDQILMCITEDNENTYICRNEWINPKLGLPTRVGGTFTMHKTLKDVFYKVKERKPFYVTSDNPEIRDVMAPYRKNFQNYLVTFVFLGDELYAAIHFSRGDEKKQWDEDEISLASYVTNVLFGALRKHEAELQLVEAKEAAEQSNRSKGIFLAHMSHEIRTPMNAILGISEIQLQDKTLQPNTEEAFRQIYDSGNLLLNIINDILDFSKIEAGKLEIIPSKYNLPSMLNDTVQLNLLRYESKPLEFKLYLDKNMPFELYGDELRIKQILNNLLSNAFKYTDTGEIILSVYAKQGKDTETVILIFQVTDTGQGMSEDQINKLFDEYSRFNMEINRTIVGTGLGMSIVKRLVEMMDGGIFVESEIGKGSTFTVRLPQKNIGTAVCGAEVADNLRNFRFHSTPNSKKTQIIYEYMPYGHVLVVDDVASNLYVAKGLLMSYGLQIETVTSGTEAVEKIKAGHIYDIVFMDHMMPVMDGMEAVKIIRGMGYTHPIVALTANAVVGQADIFLENGFDGFIPKPIDSRELDTVLKNFIRDKQPREVIEAARKEQQKVETEKSAMAGTAMAGTANASPQTNDASEIYKFFVLDGENAIKVMEEACAKLPDDKAFSSYTIAVHGIKNVLANIGEAELSGFARRLEQAGNEKNTGVITEETSAFTDALRLLIDKYKPANNEETAEISGEDTVYLRDKLLEIKTACQEFNVTAAKDALDALRQKTWPRYVNETLDEISVHLLHSAFKKAEAAAENMEKL